MQGLRFLLLEDSLLDAELIEATLIEGAIECELVRVQSGADFLAALATNSFDVILSDYSLPDFDGMSALKIAQKRCPQVPFIFVSGALGEELAIETLKSGATDYVLKQRLGRLVLSVKRAIREAQERRDRLLAQQELQQTHRLLATLIEAAPLPIAVIEPDDTVRVWNRAAENLFGWCSAEILGQPLPIIPEDRQAQCRQIKAALLAGETFSGIESDRYKRDGSRAIVSLSAALFDGSSGSDKAIVFIFEDITERKRNEETIHLLLHLSEKLNSMLDIDTLLDSLVTEAIALVNAQSGCSGLYTPGGMTCYKYFHNGQVSPLDYVWPPGQGLPGWLILHKVPYLTNDALNDTQIVRELCVRFGVRSALSTPLLNARGEILGFLEIHNKKDGSGFTPSDRENLVAVSQIAASAIQNALSYRHLQQTEEALRQNEKALRQSERLYRAIGETIDYGIWVCDPQGRNLYASESFLRLVGITQEQCSAFGWGDVLHPDDAERTIAAWKECVQAGNFWDIEHRFRGVDGNWHPILARGVPVRDETGEIICWAGINLDISSLKRAETALQESTAILNAINQTSPTLILVKDLQGRMLLANPSTLQALGKSEAEIIGKTDIEFQRNRDEAERIAQNDRRVMQSGQWQTFEEIVQGSAGRRTYLCAKSPYRDASGHIIGLISIAFDITERKQAEANLRQSEERYRYLAESIPQLVWTANAEGTLLDVNQRWLDYTGMTLAQAQSRGWQPIVYPEDVPVLSQSWTAAQKTGSYYQAEGRMRRADGVYRWHLHQAVPLINEQGQVIKWFGTATDVEEQKQLEQQRDRLLAQERTAREAAETANRIKDEFLAVLSHELRSPLNPILGWAKLLQRGNLDAPTTQRALETIERNAKLQTQLIEDLLDVSRILRGKLVLNVNPVDLGAVIHSAMETVQLAAEAKGIEVKFERQPTERGVSTLRVMGDATRLQQIVWNLLSNAIKFTSAGGRVVMCLERVIGNVDEQHAITQFAQITITDTGKGITPDFLPYVFEYFRQEDSTTTRRFGGLGLGLAIVHYLSELHGGTVKVESSGEGLGSTFTVLLPLLESRQSAASSQELDRTPPLPPGTQLAGVRILVVDDEADMRELLSAILEQTQVQVQSAASAREALLAFESFKPDILISDIGLPEVDGYKLMRQIRAFPPQQGGQIPAIALSAYAGEYDQKLALAAGFQQHIAKPVEPDRLIETIVTLLGRNR